MLIPLITSQINTQYSSLSSRIDPNLENYIQSVISDSISTKCFEIFNQLISNKLQNSNQQLLNEVQNNLYSYCDNNIEKMRKDVLYIFFICLIIYLIYRLKNILIIK